MQFVLQTLCKRAGIDKKVRQSDHDQQARFLLVIFENLAATLRITLSKTESTWGSLNWLLAICAVLRTVIVKRACTEVKMGNSLQQYRLIVGMHSVYLVAKEFRGCFKGKFWCFVLLLFYLEAIYLPVLKRLVHIYEMSQMNCPWLTQIYLYRSSVDIYTVAIYCLPNGRYNVFDSHSHFGWERTF